MAAASSHGLGPEPANLRSELGVRARLCPSIATF
jgi:hypothetical protein